MTGVQSREIETQPENKSNDSRSKIIEAALQEFGEHGYDGASTNQICQAAGISKGLLYHYFKSKENLFLAVCSKCVEDLEADFAKDPMKNGNVDINALSRFYRRQANFFSSHPNHYRILSYILGNPCEPVESYISEKRKEYKDEASIALRLFLSRSAIRPGVDKEMALELTLEIIDSILSKYIHAVYQQHMSIDLAMEMMERDLRAAVDIMLNGILQKEAKERHEENEL